jgi:6-phosphogluconolactonase
MTSLPGPDTRVFPDLAALSHAAADLVQSKAVKAIASHGRFSIALSGGSTPRTLYSLFAQHPWRDTMPWPLVHVFWADERCVAPAHQDSNYRLAADAFLSRVSLPAANVHRVHGEEGPDRAAAGYELELKAFFGTAMPAFDLILLGVGEDGHTASLFPGSPHLGERHRLVLPVQRQGPGLSRITLALQVLNSARNIMFLVSGVSKAGIVREVVEDGLRSGLPAAQVRPAQGDPVWLLDRDAAGSLTSAAASRA